MSPFGDSLYQSHKFFLISGNSLFFELKALLRYVIGCLCCIKTAPIPSLLVFVSITKLWEKSGILRTRALHIAVLSYWNAVVAFCPHQSIHSQLTGDSFHIIFGFLQWKNNCSADSTSSSQSLQVSFIFSPIFFKFTPTGILAWYAFHKKVWIFFLISRFHTFFQSFLSSFPLLLLVSAFPLSCCFLSLAVLYPKDTK